MFLTFQMYILPQFRGLNVGGGSSFCIHLSRKQQRLGPIEANMDVERESCERKQTILHQELATTSGH
jgi:hypothetical protein